MTHRFRKDRCLLSSAGSKTGASGVDRRTLLQGLAFGAGTGIVGAATPVARANPPGVPAWTRKLGAGVAAQPYGQPSPHQAHVVRRRIDWLTPTTESSVSFTPLQDLHGIVTPNGLCFERHHAGVAEVDPSRHSLMIHGLVERPLVFGVEDLMRFPLESRFYFLECAANGGMEWRGAQMNAVQFTHGMIHCVQWTGIPLRLLLEECGLTTNAAWLLVEGADAAAMTRSLPLEKALDDCMVALSQNGERLRPEQGYPLRLVAPGWEGNIWVKWLRRIEVGDRPWHTREETARYSDLMPDRRARQFTNEMDVKSVITSPCPEKGLAGKGYQAISGLAWSGRGKVKRVDLSVDGGRNWRPARLEGPVWPKCLTRFHFEWEWNGETALLQSRAIDDAGDVQPTMSQLQKARGLNSVYHNNAIQTWRINADGSVDNVRLA